MPARARLVPLIAIFAGSACFALTPVFVKFADVGPIAAGFWRMIIALPIVWIWFQFEARRRPSREQHRRTRRNTIWLVASAVAITADLSLWHSSFLYTSVANAALLGSLHPIVVAIGAWILFKETITRVFIIGLVVALAGSIAVARAGATEFSAVALGDILAILSTFGFSAYALTLKRLRQTLSTATIMLWTLTLAPMMLLPIAAIVGEQLVPQSANGWVVVIGFALVGNVAGQSMMTYAFAHLPASFSAVSLLIVPVFAAVLAWVLFQESISMLDVLDRADHPFPHSLPEFQRLFPDDAACAAYLEKARWGDGFACPHCGTAGEPFHFENRPGVLRCRKCRQNTGLTVGTVMERSHRLCLESGGNLRMA